MSVMILLMAPSTSIWPSSGSEVVISRSSSPNFLYTCLLMSQRDLYTSLIHKIIKMVSVLMSEE